MAKTKLSELQQGIVGKMRQGWTLTNNGYLAHHNADTAIKVPSTTILALINKGVLEHLMFQGRGADYKFTEDFING